jgi:segregation and condensation protein B
VQAKKSYGPAIYVKESEIKPAELKGESAMKAVIEAALFMGNGPIMITDLAKIAGLNSLGFVKEVLVKLQKDYASGGIEIADTQDGWIMQVRPEYLSHVAHLTPYSDLSEGCKRTLALVARKEPAQQAEIVRIQGNKAYTYVKQLKRRGLISKEKKGNNVLLRLTQEFERYFGEEKEKIREKLAKV